MKDLTANRFYTDFDRQTLERVRKMDYRTPFQRDRDRIIHSSALRRLQAKTQVFISGEYDFYRTRLTHSIEVAQIGRSICHFLQHQSPLLSADYYIDADLVEAVCLAHDLGHPPFGHSGESTLNRLMRAFGGFEGNAQTLRTLTETLYPGEAGRKGMNPTRALLDGVLKYKTLYSELSQPERHFLYDDQQGVLQFVFENQSFPKALSPGAQRDAFRSIECQIMDWADDTAYSLDDIVDGIRAGFITREKLQTWAGSVSLNKTEQRHLSTMEEEIARGSAQRTFSRKIGEFISACRLVETENFMSARTNRYRYNLMVDAEVRSEAEFYKRLATDIVFDSPQLHQLKFKWNHILERLFTALRENYFPADRTTHKLLPLPVHQRLAGMKGEAGRLRTICDHIAGMTDGFAIRSYKRLFDPDFGSISDII